MTVDEQDTFAQAASPSSIARAAERIQVQETSVNAVSGRVRGLWLGYLTLGTYLVIAVGSVTHKQLFLETPIKLPILNVDLPLIGFFVVAPLFFLINHFYLLLTLLSLGRRIREYNEALADQHLTRETEEGVRRKLDSFVIVLAFGGTKEEREGRTGTLLRAIAWLTVVAAPVLLFLFIQLTFLPYHLAWVTWLHRAVLIVDLTLLWVFWPAIRAGHPELPVPRLHTKPFKAMVSMLVVLFSVFVATFPGELADKSGIGIDRERTSKHADRQTPKDWVLWPLKKWLFEGDVAEVSGRRTSLFSRTLVMPDQDFVDDKRLDEIKARAEKEGKKPRYSERTFVQRERDFRGAVLARADLRHADLAGANFQGADLSGARLEGANLRMAQLQGAHFFFAQLQGADLDSAQMQGAFLWLAHLQGADLFSAQLQGANLVEAQLQGVNLGLAQLQGAVLSEAHLQGANLQMAQLQGANLARAELQGANLQAELQGAVLDAAQLQGASLWNAQLQGADLDLAELQGADLRWAEIWQVRPPQEPMIKDADLRNLAFSRPNQKELQEVLASLKDETIRQRVKERLMPLLQSSKIEAWTNSPARRAWTDFSGRSRPDPKAQATILAGIACGDATGGYVIKVIARRISEYDEQDSDYAKLTATKLIDQKTCPAKKHLSEEMLATLGQIAGLPEKKDEAKAKTGE